MGKRLVTIATFDQAAQARLAKNVLDEAGIQATISDETIVAMDWLLSNAVGGVKVQVWEEDADRAVTVLEQKLGEHGEGLGDAVSPEELAAEAEAATPEDGEEPEPPSASDADAPLEAGPPSERDVYARRAAFTAILEMFVLSVGSYSPLLGFACVLLLFYVLYLIFNAGFGEGELSPRGRLNLFVGGAIMLSELVWVYLLFRLYGQS